MRAWATRWRACSAQAPVPGAAAALFASDLARSLVPLLADASESVRESVAGLIGRFVEADGASGADIAPAVPLLVPVLAARVGRLPFPEESEEIRLALAQLLIGVLSKPAAAAAATAALADVVDVVKALATDAFPAVKTVCTTLALLLARRADASLSVHVAPMVTALVPCLAHQRGPVRVGALDAVTALLPLGGESTPRVAMEVVLPALKSLRFDRLPAVRKQLACAVGGLLRHLPPFALHAESLDAHLLSLLAGLIADETGEVGAQALSEVNDVAAHAGTARAPAVTSLPADVAAAAGAASGHETVARSPPSVAGDGLPDGAVTWLPPHVSARPPVTTRRFVGALSAAAAPLVLADLRDWTGRVRAFAAGALRSLFTLAEDALTPQLDHIIAALTAGSRDDEPDVRRLLADVARQVGVYIPPDVQLGVLLPQLRGEVSGVNTGAQHASALAVLAAAVGAMSPTSLAAHLPAIARTLAMPHLADDDPPALRHQLALAVAAVTSVVTGGAGSSGDRETLHADSLPAPARPRALSSIVSDGHGSALEAVSLALQCPDPHSEAADVDMTRTQTARATVPAPVDADSVDCLLTACLVLNDLAAADEDAQTGRLAMTALARMLHLPRAVHLLAARVHVLLPRLLADSAGWTRSSHNRRLFDTLVRIARPALSGTGHAAAHAHAGACVAVFVHTLAPSRDPEVRAAMLGLLDGFIAGGPDEQGGSDDATAPRAADTATTDDAFRSLDVPAVSAPVVVTAPRADAFTVSNATVDWALSQHADTLMRQALLPCCVWRVGAVAATLRKVAILATAKLMSRKLLPADALLPVLDEFLPTLRSCASDDDATTRNHALHLLSHTVQAAGALLTDSQLRDVYPDLLKRLDDSDDGVRINACAALHSLATSVPATMLAGGPVEHTIDALLVHLDDADATVQQAVFHSLTAWVEVDGAYARRKLSEARLRHRSPALCDALLTALGE